MPLSTVVLQNLQFPDREEYAACTDLFYRPGLSQERPGDRAIVDDCRWDFTVDGGAIVEDRRPPLASGAGSSPRSAYAPHYDAEAGCIVVPAGETADLSCYLNMLSAQKWLDLTHVENITLRLEIEGEARIDLHGYKLPDFETQAQVEAFKKRRRKGRGEKTLQASVINSASCAEDGRATVMIPIGHPDATLVGVSVTAKTGTRIHGGAWLGSVEAEHVRDVDLCLVTTTFRREDYITRNIGIVKAALEGDAELAAHLQMIVVDNGRTLDPGKLEDRHVRIVGNVNAGGSGGFARGMIEALRAAAKPTHLLLVDDDVLVLPESIRRTRALLQVLRPEYRDHFVSGAMLRLESMSVQHEDVGIINVNGDFQPKKGPHALTTVVDCAFNDTRWPACDHEYASWWYCCIPMGHVTEQTLPVPFFIRGDDVEFSIRNKAGVISMNGICVWHKGFSQKISASIEYYQVLRNSLIIRAFHPECNGITFMEHCQMLLTQQLNKLEYDYADLILDAIEDYLDGPAILEQPNGADVLAEKARKNERLVPLAQVWPGKVDFGRLFDEGKMGLPHSVVRRKLVTASCNGHLFAQSLVKDETGFAAYDMEHLHEPLFFKQRVISVNPVDTTAALHERDPERFAEVHRRRQALLERYRNEGERVAQAYRDAYPRLTSLGFWKRYLGID